MPPKEVLKKIIEEVIEEKAAKEKETEGKTEPVVEDKKQAAIAARVDLTNAELLERLGEQKEKNKEAADCQCGACGATFKGELERCPECGKKLTW